MNACHEQCEIVWKGKCTLLPARDVDGLSPEYEQAFETASANTNVSRSVMRSWTRPIVESLGGIA